MKQLETKVINLYWNGDKHYDTVTKVTGLLGCVYYCEYCDKGYTERGDHRCNDGCDGCYSDIPCILDRKSNVLIVRELLRVKVVLIIIRQLRVIRRNLFVNLYTIVKSVQVVSLVAKRIMYNLVIESVRSVRKL